MGHIDKTHAVKVVKCISKAYPVHQTLLQYTNAFELLISVILSAQTTDEQVNSVTGNLFRKYPIAEDLSRAKLTDVEKIIFKTGFYKNKAKNIIGAATHLVEKYDSQVPNSMEELITLPGVGRKTAGVVLYHIFGIPAIIVDTHFGRVCRRLGLTEETDPVKVEFAIRNLLPKQLWGEASMVINFHGRKVCKSRQPDCDHCVANRLCVHKEIAKEIK